MRWWGENWGLGLGGSRVGRLRRALLLLAAVACFGAALLYWQQQVTSPGLRPFFITYSSAAPQWTWFCRNERCERSLASETVGPPQSLQTCNMLCASTQLWPQPTGLVRLSNRALPLRADTFSLHILHSPSDAVTEHLQEAFRVLQHEKRQLESASNGKRSNGGTSYSVVVRVEVNGTGDPRMRLRTDESYKLDWKSSDDNHKLLVDISANSFCGARHGFETLSQLIWFDPYSNSLLTLMAGSVTDAPRFEYRGLLLDTARNYFPVEDLLRTIDAMAASKLNTFHWHVSDSQSFPLQLKSVPELAQHGAYDQGSIYTREDVQAVVRHAQIRGIRVLLEVDAPSHVGRAWEWGPTAGLGQLAYCIELEPWSQYCGEPPCGQLNPRNPNVYEILQKIYAEIIELTGVDDIFHLGGDEVNGNCWQQHFNDTDPMELWYEFTKNAMRSLERANGGKAPEVTLLWSSGLTRYPYLDRLSKDKYGIQIWGAAAWAESHAVLDSGYRSVISHVDAWYLDCGFGSWRDSSDGHCGPYRSWQQMYEHRPWVDEVYSSKSQSWQIDGGEACQWTEQLGSGGLDARVWPRAAAVAERLWADRAAGADADVYLRLDTHRARLAARGLRPALLWPSWCTQNPHQCL